ncbi:MAG: hypothetical protein IJO08_02270 [Clostridia bacterium]|nr:hypothetical protein [Clostridia bacterium]
MKNQRGVTLVTVVIMVVIMAIIATVSITGGVSVIHNAQDQVKERNLTDVKVIVSREAAKFGTSGVLTPVNIKYYGLENVELAGTKYNDDGTTEDVIQKIGEDWYFLDEDSLVEMGIEFAEETYVVNYRYNIVIPLSSVENIHAEIEYYNGLNNQ